MEWNVADDWSAANCGQLKCDAEMRGDQISMNMVYAYHLRLMSKLSQLFIIRAR